MKKNIIVKNRTCTRRGAYSLAVVLLPDFVARHGLKPGDQVEMYAHPGRRDTLVIQAKKTG